MFTRLTLPVVFVALAYGLWTSSTFTDIASGVAVFLFGMLCMEAGFKAFSGGALEGVLRRSTDRVWKSLGFGIVTTTLMQSSSLVSVITISFLSAGLIDLAQGIGVIFGANLGTTTGAWLVAGFGLKVKISAYAMPMLIFGVLMLLREARSSKGAGWILVGLGFLFLGIHFMKEGFAGFSDTLDLTRYAMTGVAGLLVFSLFGVIATVVMQSSHATLVLIITALGAGQITYENALALAVGANVGTTITAIIGSLGAPVEGKRLAAAHLAFNLGTGLIALVFMGAFVRAVDVISREVGIPADDHTLKLAVFHTLFNLVGVALFTPFIDRMAAALEHFLKGKALTRDTPHFLSATALEFPEVALTALRRETLHLFDNAFTIIAHGMCLRRSDVVSERDLRALLEARAEVIELDVDRQYELVIKDIYSANIAFFTRATAKPMSEALALRFKHVLQANLDLIAAIKATKHLRKNLVHFVASPNPHIRREYNRLRINVGEMLRDLAALRSEDVEAVTKLSLDALKVHLADARRYGHRAVAALIRDDLITPQMATSLMNDSAYAHELMSHLLGMAEALVEALDAPERIPADLSLSAEEVAAVLDRTDDANGSVPRPEQTGS
ncbi:Na/Pi cotransporter family protein [Nitrogeniibacter mangrovi]|uniref:Na/Pi cotransporter family protein n=1 Tax=Nitrogeniibacter mangrovi TaxID=2016596 RepID=A0A6C1BA54_9RHOO|nr:Na/Pi symporter [Nitrogeniibacter mangrovi]QID19144.1 Na/Pi cotransporter family protein [Nitrogeniibacter mangrovi]